LKVALFTTEVEYTTAMEALKEVIWLKGFVEILGLHQEVTMIFL